MRRRTFIQTLPLAAAASAVAYAGQSNGPGAERISQRLGSRSAQIPTCGRRALHPARRSRRRPALRAPALPRARPRWAARQRRARRIRWPRRPQSKCSSAADRPWTRPLPPMLCWDLWSPSAPASAATALPSSGTRRRASSRAWPAPAVRPNRSRWPLCARARKTASFPHSAPSASPRPARSTAGGRCTSATASSSGPSSSSPAIHRLRRRRSHAADHRLLHQAQHGGVSAPRLRR